ncbi:MAG TPA: hypothetical protein VN817_06735 [Solirubrobacteraceae bacterium]|nr:hypothetical protein [Solirubrobacteraceae bacterium]
MGILAGHIGQRRQAAGVAARAVALAALAATFAPQVGLAHGPVARSSRTLNATDTAHLRYNPKYSEGATLIEEGSATGSLPGKMRARLKIEGTFSGTFSLTTSGGTLKGHGAAKPSGSGRFESFRGSLVVTGGTGRFAHARGTAGLYGVFDRVRYQVTVQTTGSISY